MDAYLPLICYYLLTNILLLTYLLTSLLSSSFLNVKVTFPLVPRGTANFVPRGGKQIMIALLTNNVQYR